MAKISNRELNVKVFEDTMQRFQEDKLKAKTQKSIENQVLIKESQSVSYDLEKYEAPCKIYVTKNRTMEAAAEYYGKKVAVLNFASATNPGGGVTKGSSAQEECLCRVSNLYTCLSDRKLWTDFYKPHKESKDNIHNDDIIYTPDVYVIKDDNYNLLETADRFQVDVITCAAPNLRENPNNPFNHDLGEAITLSNEELYKVHFKRATKILEVAASFDVEVLILGAFGCGAFRNNPKVVAKAFKDALGKFRKAFKEIEFAIYCSSWDCTNYESFKAIF